MPPEIFVRFLKPPSRSFFLFGPRGVGKSTWLKSSLPQAMYIDLLESGLYLELSRAPERLESMIGNNGENTWIIIDEIQRVPDLLNEVHRLIEKKPWRFALCGSSARKLRRGGTNLLGGRALTRHLETFSFAELGKIVDINFALEWGLLPSVQTDRDNAADILNAYVNTYIKEEIKEEGIVRSLPPFLRFLQVCGMLNGQLVNAQNIAREAGVPRSSIDVYFSIMQDTLLGHFLPPYRPQAKVREGAHPKFYWFDPGAARAAAGLLFDQAEKSWKGTALETIVYHELRIYNHVKQKNREIAYYRTAGGVEIDFVIETKKRQQSSVAHIVCIEVKLASKWDTQWEKHMRTLTGSNQVKVDRMIGIYTGERRYNFNDIDVLPIKVFIDELYKGNIF
jgi:predicted AAA+ superfamily ATPase